MTRLTSYTEAMQATMQAWRHDIHRHPELAFEEQRTASKVAELLAEFGIEVHTSIGEGFCRILVKLHNDVKFSLNVEVVSDT